MSLTNAELERQDLVDNAIFELLQKLVPINRNIQWNIDMIGGIRDTIRYWIVEYYGLIDESAFYPFAEE